MPTIVISHTVLRYHHFSFWISITLVSGGRQGGGAGEGARENRGGRGTGVGRRKGGMREGNAKRYLLSFTNALQYLKKTRTQIISDLHSSQQ